MYYVYAIKSINKNYIYVGLTKNLKRRTNQHNCGQEKTTRFYHPFKLIYVEVFKSRSGARIMEKYLKSGYGKEILKELALVAELAYAQD